MAENYKVKCEMFQCSWQYLDGGQYKSYDDTNHVSIESAFQEGASTLQIRRDGSRYTIDLKARVARAQSGSATKIRRWVLFKPSELREYTHQTDKEAFMGKGLSNGNASKIKALFNKYISEDYDSEEDDEPYIGEDGIVAISHAIGIDPAEDIEILVLSWQMDCADVGQWTQQEFYLGLSRLRCTSLSQLKSKVSHLKGLIASKESFKAFYFWAFYFFKDTAQKGMVGSMAAGAWALMLKGRCALLPELLEFMDDYDRGVSLNTWGMMLPFSYNVKRDLTGWSELFPPFYDDFVEWLEDNKGIYSRL